jgi:hypothetical protein
MGILPVSFKSAGLSRRNNHGKTLPPLPAQKLSTIIMSAVCILTPMVIMAWPAFSSAVVAAAASLGYQVAAEAHRELPDAVTHNGAVRLATDCSESITNQPGCDQRIFVSREGVTGTFSSDALGRASLCVTGNGHTQGALRAMGEELTRAVVQQYIYRKLTDQMRTRGFSIVKTEVHEDRSIRLKVRHWEG